MLSCRELSVIFVLLLDMSLSMTFTHVNAALHPGRLAQFIPALPRRPTRTPYSNILWQRDTPPLRYISSSSTVLSSTAAPAFFPRAAVAVVVRWRDSSSTAIDTSSPRWLLVQRGNEPNKGQWSIPGGKIEPGEGTMEAAKREIFEETGLITQPQQLNNDSGEVSISYDLKWHNEGPFASSDSIHHPKKGSSTGFHYVISQCFAEVVALSI